jgi:hypothetical protein
MPFMGNLLLVGSALLVMLVLVHGWHLLVRRIWVVDLNVQAMMILAMLTRCVDKIIVLVT